MQAKEHEIDKYIIDTFDLFLLKKTEIVIDIHEIGTYFKELSDLIMYQTERYENEESNNNNSYLNTINPRIFPMFVNLNKVVINTTDSKGSCEYRFSLLSFLSSIQSYKSSIKYVIKAKRNSQWNKEHKKWEYYGTTWLNDFVDEAIKQRFNDEKWNIDISKPTYYEAVTVHEMM
eukprot:440607_1